MSDHVTRGNLPHWYRPGFAQFVTYRLAGTLPAAVLQELRNERLRRLHAIPRQDSDWLELRAKVHKLMFAKYDRLLDAPSAVRWLSDPRVADAVRENLYHHHRTKYELLAYCVMPNHVHVVLQPFESSSEAAAPGDFAGEAFDTEFETLDGRGVLSRVMHSLKSYTASRANNLLKRSGKFWQRESYDHWIRDVDELERIVAYVAANPVRAGLCERPHDWRFSSAYDRHTQDGSESALIGWLRDDWQRA